MMRSLKSWEEKNEGGPATVLESDDRIDGIKFFKSASLEEKVLYSGKRTAVISLFPKNAYLYSIARLSVFSTCCCGLALSTSLNYKYSNDPSGFIVILLRRIVYLSIIFEISGFATMSGPLGSGNKRWYSALKFRLTLGTLKQPLYVCENFPLKLRGQSRTRGLVDVIGFAVFLFFLCIGVSVSSLSTGLINCRTDIHSSILVMYTFLCIRDRTVYTGSMGAYYYPLIVCLCFPAFGNIAEGDNINVDRIRLSALVQAFHIFVPGVAKCGPWFYHVIPTMVGMCPTFYFPKCTLFPIRWMIQNIKNSLYTNVSSGNLQPSKLAKCIAAFGAVTELVIPALWVSSSVALQLIGVFLAVGMHLWIIFMFPIGAVQEWNFANILITFGLHHDQIFSILEHKRQEDSASKIIPTEINFYGCLFVFVVTVEFALPLLGHIKPDLLSNHFCLRKYTGNHPFHTFLLKKSKKEKLRFFKTFNDLDPYSKENETNDQDDLSQFVKQFTNSSFLASLIRGRLNTKPLCTIFKLAVELVNGGEFESFERIGSDLFLGQTMLDISYVDSKLLEILRKQGQFVKGELLSIRISSFPTFCSKVYSARWEVRDVGDDGRIIAAGEISTSWSTSKVFCRVMEPTLANPLMTFGNDGKRMD